MDHRQVAEADCATAAVAQAQEVVARLLEQRQRLVEQAHVEIGGPEVGQGPRSKQLVVGRWRQTLVQAQCLLVALDRNGERIQPRLGKAQGRQMLRLEVDTPDRLCDADGSVQRNGGLHLLLEPRVADSDEAHEPRLEVEPLLPAQFLKGRLRLLSRGHRIGVGEPLQRLDPPVPLGIGRVDVLIHLVGGFTMGATEEFSYEDWLNLD